MIIVHLWNIEIRLSLLFPAMLVVLLALDTSGMAAWCVAASAMHEAGHFLALLAVHNKPAQICVGIFGIRVTQNNHTPLSYRQNVLVSLAGPAVNLLSFAILLASGGWSVPTSVHLVMGLLNLLPVEPLDGGQALFCCLAQQLEQDKADRIVFGVSIATILPLAVLGFTVLIYSGYNFTLLALCLYLCLLLLFKKKR